jgi:CMP-N,N'-diacetyllegionaminic acid synthase
MKILALIPARIGSKSIPKKNIREIGGKPLIAYSIEHGLASKLIDRVVVSTDSEEIAKVARAFGAEVPFLRPSELAEDYSLDIDFHRHAVEWLRKNENYLPDAVINLRPTTPVRDPMILDKAIELFMRHPEIDSMRAVRPAQKTPYKMWRLRDDGLMDPLFDSFEKYNEPYNLPRQLLPEVVVQDGYFDITRTSIVLKKNSTTGLVVMPFLVPGEEIDIDYESDMEKAEKLL